MRYLKVLLLLAISFQSFAQGDYPYELKICPTDTGEHVAKMMIRDIAQYTAKDYQLVYVDSQRSRIYEYMFRSPQQDMLRITYKYTNDDDGKRVTYMSIWGELGLITGVFNYIFQSEALPQDVMDNITIGTSLEYAGRDHHFALEADDRRPGYWQISFVN